MVFDYIQNSKELKTILKKYDKRLQLYEGLISDLNVQSVLSTSIDEYGEKFSLEYMNKMKKRVAENFVFEGHIQDYWLSIYNQANFDIQSNHLE